jgi:hypothetical protein
MRDYRNSDLSASRIRTDQRAFKYPSKQHFESTAGIGRSPVGLLTLGADGPK